jgi:O-antigen/teichoic acid export membrane protein
VKAAGNAFMLLGIVGAIVIALIGLLLSGGLHLSPANYRIAPVVFAIAGLGFGVDRMFSYSIVVLQGLRHFRAVSALSIAATLLRAAGIVVLTDLGAGLLPIAVCQAGVAGIAAVAGLAVLRKIEPSFAFRVSRFNWTVLRPHLSFGVISQLNTIAGKIIWDLPPLTIGLVLGSEWIATYNVAQKFPVAVTTLIWAAALVLFPAAAKIKIGDFGHARELLNLGTRWIVVLTIPLCLLLIILAPELLQVWIGKVESGTVLLFRFITIAVAIESIGACSIELLWGFGESRTVFAVLATVALISLSLSLALLPSIGIMGAAWGLLIPIALGTAAILGRACKAAGIHVSELLSRTFDGLPFAAISCCAAAYAIQYCLAQGQWISLVGSSLAGVTAYVFTLFLRGARPEERRLIQDLFSTLLPLAEAANRYIHQGLLRISALAKKWL